MTPGPRAHPQSTPACFHPIQAHLSVVHERSQPATRRRHLLAAAAARAAGDHTLGRAPCCCCAPRAGSKSACRTSSGPLWIEPTRLRQTTCVRARACHGLHAHTASIGSKASAAAAAAGACTSLCMCARARMHASLRACDSCAAAAAAGATATRAACCRPSLLPLQAPLAAAAPDGASADVDSVVRLCSRWGTAQRQQRESARAQVLPLHVRSQGVWCTHVRAAVMHAARVRGACLLARASVCCRPRSATHSLLHLTLAAASVAAAHSGYVSWGLRNPSTIKQKLLKQAAQNTIYALGRWRASAAA